MLNVLHALIGAIAALLGVIGIVPYIRDTLRRKTKPERAMWWIYVSLFALLFGAQAKAGAHWLLLVTGTYTITTGTVAVLSLRYGYGVFHKRDMISLIVATLGLLMWLLTSKPLLAISTVVIVDFSGFWLTLVKSWHAPHSETLLTWQLALITALLSIFSVNTWSISVILYPVYAMVGVAALVWVIMYRRTKVKEDPVDF